ncbi:unnamed protein product [Mytilus edulis]|uniref:Uncharacterized protein n=1 Tax=Mytilus edulis TaxID=6550 RepID=A0A8S3Q237_MYTED|nr:unnamed protein product [Mytilus edulis]
MLQGCAILVFTISLNGHVFANTCEDDKCITAMDIPLITQLNAPLKAELDISILTEQLKELITHEVKQAVSVVTKDLAEGIVDKKTQSALENLQIVNNQTISTFLKEMKVAMTAFIPNTVFIRFGSVVKFSDVRFSEGMGDLSTFKNTGKFKCGKSGFVHCVCID